MKKLMLIVGGALGALGLMAIPAGATPTAPVPVW